MREGDTLAGIAAALYGDASLWYKIAEANGITGQAALVEGQALTLPAGVQRATHNAATFQPYDPSETIGDTSPVTPHPARGKKCGVLGQILLVVIAVAVTLATRLPAIKFVAGLIGKGAAATAIGAAAAGAAGSIVSQGIGVATGIQDKFSWNAVALTALSAGVSGVGDAAASALGVTNKLAFAAVSGAVNSALTQGIAIATGLQDKFSWSAVAAAGIGAGVGHAVAVRLPANLGPTTSGAIVSGASAIANAATRSLIDGSDFGDNLIAALPDVIGQTTEARPIGLSPRPRYKRRRRAHEIPRSMQNLYPLRQWRGGVRLVSP